MPVHASRDEPWGDCVFVMGDHVENGVGEDEPSDQFVFSGVIKVQKLVICGNAVYFRFLTNGNTNNTVDDNPTKRNILNRLVSFLLKQDYIFLIVLKKPYRLGISQSEYFFGRKVQLIEVLVRLEVALFGFIVGLLSVDQVISKLFELDFVEAGLGKKYFLRSIRRNN